MNFFLFTYMTLDQTNDQDNFSNGAYDNLDPELEQFECMQKINIEYSIHVPIWPED